MAGEIVTTICGNITADPKLNTVSGQDVVNFTIASTPRVYDQEAKDWKDGNTTFVRVARWGHDARNIYESLEKGSRVMATGTLSVREYENEGKNYTSVDLRAEEVSLSLKYGTAEFTKSGKGQTSSAPAPKSAPSAPAPEPEQAAAPAEEKPKRASRASAAKPRATADAGLAGMFG